MTAATIDHARAAKTKLSALLNDVPQVRGVGIAVVEGGYALKVNVLEPMASLDIPCEIDGVPVLVSVVDVIRPV